MKNLSTSILLLVLTLAVSVSASAQAIYRVSNNTPANVAQKIYSTFAAAQTAAANNDIIQIEPGTYSLDITLTKPLVVVGTGYFLDQYTGTAALQANTTPATVTNISFDAGSTGASVSGITASQCYISASGITVQRCRITNQLYVNFGATVISNINIRQNYLVNITNYYGSGSTNLLITNNIITQTVSFDASCSGEFRQNVLPPTPSYSATLTNFNVTNNYFGYFYAGPTLANCTVTYNAFYFASYPTAGNNINNVPGTSTFVLAPGSAQFDAWYQLKTGTNPLRSSGENGADMGVFAGNAPYKLGGLPTIPAIYQLSNSVSGGTLNVNLSTRSNN